jgi:hypothetical protein
VFLSVGFCGLGSMMLRVLMVPASGMGVVRSLFMAAALVVLCRFLVVMRGMLVMFCCLQVMLCCLL